MVARSVNTLSNSVLFTDIILLLFIIFSTTITFSRTEKSRRTLTPMFRSLLWQSLTEVWGTPSISDTGEERISILPEKDHTGFFLLSPLKVLSVRLHSKSHQKSVRIYLPKKLVIFRGAPVKKTSQELRMLSSVTLDCQVKKIIMNSGSQL